MSDLGFLQNLKSLWSLDIKLGGTNNLVALAGMNGIKYLELWQIKGLCDLSFISKMLGLQYLFLQALPHITSLPRMSDLKALRRVSLINMKGLKDLSPLLDLSAIEEFIHSDARGMEPEQYADLLNKSTIKKVSVKMGSTRKNEVFSKMAARACKKEFTFSRDEVMFKFN